MKKIAVALVMVSVTFALRAQVKEAHFTAAGGNSQGTVSLLAGYNWECGAKKKFAVGLGFRFTSYFGSSQYYRTAPARLTSGSTGPLVLFKEDIPENIDTLRVQSPQVNSLNLAISFRYALSARFQIGFNIDAIGFSFGSNKQGVYLNYPASIVTKGSPASFNLLLISDNDRGSLNSELYARYRLSERWALKAGAQFHFTEYITDTEVQQFPEPNDRFRNKSFLFAIGAVRKW